MLIRRANDLKRADGFSLIEVLVAMLLLAIGVLGAAAMQLQALKYNKTAGARTQATFLAYSILDSMRANRGAAVNNDYNIEMAAAPSGNTIAAKDIGNWKTAVAEQLPSGDGSIKHELVSGADKVTIVLSWDESRVGGNSNINAPDATDSEKNIQTFTFVTQL